MFQYAAARAMADRNHMELVLDAYTGFARDKVYRRSFSLDSFDLSARFASNWEQSFFLFERLVEKCRVQSGACVEKRPWGYYLKDSNERFNRDLVEKQYQRNVWLDGHWQSEKYFTDIRRYISEAFELKAPTDQGFLAVRKTLQRHKGVAVGVRLYEEAPSLPRLVAPWSFYEETADRLAEKIDSPVFYVFCTARKLIDGQLNLPGQIRFITHDDGYVGELSRLWLLSRFKYHVISNSSFYWWGAWLAEQQHSNVEVHACKSFV